MTASAGGQRGLAVAILIATAPACGPEVRELELRSSDRASLVAAPEATLLILEAEGERAWVRLTGVHVFGTWVEEPAVALLTTEARQHVASEWRDALIEFYPAHPPIDERDTYHGYLLRGTTELNRHLITYGRAIVDTESSFRYEPSFLAAEKGARAGKRGLWRWPAAVERARWLRSEWAAARAERGDPVDDPWLEEQAAAWVVGAVQ